MENNSQHITIHSPSVRAVNYVQRVHVFWPGDYSAVYYRGIYFFGDWSKEKSVGQVRRRRENKYNLARLETASELEKNPVDPQHL